MPKISYASTMIVEDHLKKLLTSNTAKPFKCWVSTASSWMMVASKRPQASGF